MSDSKDLVQALAGSDFVKLGGVDVDGIIRGKVISKEKFLGLVQSKHGLGFCEVVFKWDMHDKPYDSESADDIHYPDLPSFVDPVPRTLAWDPLPFFFIDFYNDIKTPLPMCSRGLLKGMIKRYNELGLVPLAGLEYEWFTYRETPDSWAQKKGMGPQNLTPGMFGYSLLRPESNTSYLQDIMNYCQKSNIDIEGLHTETGPGVLECALGYKEALQMADSAVLFKLAVKTAAIRNGLMASFMTKPRDDLPGCSGHMHISLGRLVDGKVGENAFARTEGPENGDVPGSPEFGHFIAGVLKGLPSIQPFLCPTVNSYKRLVEGYWAPVDVSWGPESRAATLRVISPEDNPKATRVEVRLPGSDANPYFALASVLACGLHGIENRLTLPPPIQKLTEKPRSLAKNLRDATTTMAEPDSLARKVLGDALIDHFAKSRMHEVRLWECAVTDWDRARYLEIL